MNYSYIFGLLAGITALIAYGLYFKQIFKGQSTPNPSTWGIWFLIGIINAITYFSVTNDNLWQSFIVIAVTLSVFIILVYARIKGRFARVSNIEIIIFVLALVIGFFWQITSNDRVANLLLQGTYIISYIPTIFGIIKGTGKEHYVAWSTVIVAYLFSTISLLFDPGVDWIAYVHPIVNGLLGNGVIVALILLKKTKKI
ncbi:MAG: hypothetical protein WC675_01820 [Patescibacteria group bacterium]|jgi:hypothetical protein